MYLSVDLENRDNLRKQLKLNFKKLSSKISISSYMYSI